MPDELTQTLYLLQRTKWSSRPDSPFYLLWLTCMPDELDPEVSTCCEEQNGGRDTILLLNSFLTYYVRQTGPIYMYNPCKEQNGP